MKASPNHGMATVAKRLYRKLKALRQPPLHRAEVRLAHTVLGSEYGGWPVIDGSLTQESVIYSFGIGHDISFDLALIDRFGCVVQAFDPTPRCVEWLQSQDLPEQFVFHPVGISDKAETLVFRAPAEEGFVSYTIGKRTDSDESVRLPVKPLSEIMSDLGHDRIDLLKMDVEGSEYAVVSDLLAKGILPRQLCVEFHHGMFGFDEAQTLAAVRMLKDAGYVIYFVASGGREYGFTLDVVEGNDV